MGPFAEAKKFCGDKEAYLKQVKFGPVPPLSLLEGDWFHLTLSDLDFAFILKLVCKKTGRGPKLFLTKLGLRLNVFLVLS